VLLDAGGMRPILGVGAMTGQAHRVARLAQHRLIFRAVRIVATETRDAARVHEALNDQVSDLYSSFGIVFACLISAETTVWVSLLATFASVT
jgi:hypothetical protein